MHECKSSNSYAPQKGEGGVSKRDVSKQAAIQRVSSSLRMGVTRSPFFLDKQNVKSVETTGDYRSLTEAINMCKGER